MKNEVITTGKTVEAALIEAAKQLGADKELLTYEVLKEGKRGFLGIGAVDAEIKARYEKQPSEYAVEFLKKLIDNMGIEAEITVKNGENGNCLIDVTGEASGALIGHHGETLDQLQYLVNLAANRDGDDDYMRISVDVEGYRAKREETLCGLAERMAAKVLKYKKNYTFEPMSAYERRIIHSAVQNIEGVTTYSIGSENCRRVVIAPEGAQHDENGGNGGNGGQKSSSRRRRSRSGGHKPSANAEPNPFAYKFLET